MKIIKENWLIVLICAFILTVSTCTVKADDWDGEKYDFKWMHVPVVCGITDEVKKYLDNNEFVLQSISIGREGAKKDGDPAYFVTYYLNKEGNESVSAITSPTGHETCMMYRSFDLRSPGTSL